MPSIVYLNGEFLPITQAQVPVMDRGFLFGDAVYEVIPFFNGVGFAWSSIFSDCNTVWMQ